MAVLRLAGVTFKNEDGSSRQEVLRTLYLDFYTEGRRDEIELELRAEVGNRFDENAVSVHVKLPREFEGWKIGYVERDDAPLVRRALAAGLVGRVRFADMAAGNKGKMVTAKIGLARAKPNAATPESS